jgi:ERCC4-type nuclease
MPRLWHSRKASHRIKKDRYGNEGQSDASHRKKDVRSIGLPVQPTTTSQPTTKSQPEIQEKDYVSVIKKVKKENITPENIGEIMLCQIPGISAVTALTIMDQFKTLPNLIKELELNNECLKDISSTNAKGQTRKINKTSIANIVKFLSKK